MKRIYTFSLVCIIGFGVYYVSWESKETIPLREAHSSVIRDSVFLGKYGYGYDIIVHGEVRIHQPLIPAIGGNSGFASAEDASKIAQLVISKMRDDEFLPSITLKELHEAGIIIYDYKSGARLNKGNI